MVTFQSTNYQNGFRNKNKTVSCGCLFYFKNRCTMERASPHYYGKWRSVHKRCESWCRKGIWSFILATFRSDCDNEWFMVDATIVRAHPCASGYERNQNEHEALGLSKGGVQQKYMLLLTRWVKSFVSY